MVRPHTVLECEGGGEDSYISWGSATLAYLYQKFGVTSRGHSNVISGHLAFLKGMDLQLLPMLSFVVGAPVV